MSAENARVNACGIESRSATSQTLLRAGAEFE
jgi:hypothetical protein